MKQLVAAFVGGALAAVLAGGLIYNNYQNQHLSSNISEVLAEFLIAGQNHCEQDNCVINNVVSPYFQADRIQIIHTSGLLAYLHGLNDKTNILSDLANSWSNTLRGSKLWWLIYDAKVKDPAEFELEIKNFHFDISQMDSLMLLLSPNAKKALLELNKGFNLKLNFYKDYNLITISKPSESLNNQTTSESTSFSYELKSGVKSCDEDCPFDILWDELDIFIPFHLTHINTIDSKALSKFTKN